MSSLSKRRGAFVKLSAGNSKMRGRRAIESAVEPLETRTLMSTTITYQVQGASDVVADVNQPAGVNTFKSNTLRAAIDAANAQPFPVIIDLTKVSGTITLTSTAAHPNPTFLLGSAVATTNGHSWKFVGNGKQIISGAGLYGVFNIGLGSPGEFDNLTISHGKAGSGAVPILEFQGGAIGSLSPLTLAGDTFTSDTATFGGAVASILGNFSATNCTFNGNSADFGGAVGIDDAIIGVAPIFTGDTFIGNTAVGNGGAIINQSNANSTLAITNSTFTGNTASEGGGALYNYIDVPGTSVAVTITGTKFTSNIASEDNGGAIFSDGSKLTVTGTTFTTNRSTDDSGGAIYSEDDTLSVSTSTFTGDSAEDSGGGIYFYGTRHSPTLIVTNSIFTNDVAVDDNGGGIAIGEEGEVDNVKPNFTNVGINSTISGSTFTGDTARDEGGAVYSAGGPQSSLTITNSTFTHNTAFFDAGGAIYTGDPTVAISGSSFTSNHAADDRGGALFSDATTLSVGTSSFTNNVSYDNGGGIYFDGEDATVTASTFSGDFSEHDSGGGGIYSDASSLTVSGTTFTANIAPNGGGIFSFDDNLSVDTTTFNNNTAQYDGGGIDFQGVSATVTNSSFTNNTAAADDGGGIFVGGERIIEEVSSAAPNQGNFDAITLSVSNTTFTNNSAALSGGGIYFEDDEEINQQPPEAAPNVGLSDESGLFIWTSTFTGNTAGTGGGGVYAYGENEDDELDVFNSTFNNNSTVLDGGGGVYSAFEFAQFANDTFFANGAGSDEGGGGLYLTFPFVQLVANLQPQFENVTVTDSTFDANHAGFNLGGGIGQGIFEIGGVLLDGDIIAQNYVNGTPGTYNDLQGNYDPTSTNNIIGDLGNLGVVTGFVAGNLNGNFVGTNLAPIDPMLAPLADNGGPTQTQALLPGSLAIGNNSNFVVFDVNDQDITATDQRGVDRPQKQGYDIGAYQSVPGLDDHFVWITPATAIKGQPFSVTVEALTNLNVVDNTFDESVTITSSDAAAAGLPGPGTLVFTNGVASFMPTLNTVGSQTFTITDTTTGTNTPPATSNPIIVSAPVVPVTPTLNISNATAAAPTSGSATVPMTFTVTLSAASASTVTVTYGTMQGTASSGHGDYTGVTSATLTFAPGQTSKTITVQIKKATFPQSTYTPPYTASHPGVYFYVLLTNANNALLGTGTGIGTITY